MVWFRERWRWATGQSYHALLPESTVATVRIFPNGQACPQSTVCTFSLQSVAGSYEKGRASKGFLHGDNDAPMGHRWARIHTSLATKGASRTQWKPTASHVCRTPAPSPWAAALPSPPRTDPAQTYSDREGWADRTRDLWKGGEECPGRQRACEDMLAHAGSVSIVMTLRKQPSVSPFPVLREPGCEPTPGPGA
jgi:hypothetical protein